MKKTLKVLAVLVGVALGLILILAVALPFLIDPNQYKGQIVQAVKDQTGRELKIEGKIGLSVFPWIGLRIAGVELANAPGFGREPFARVESAGVQVALWPLLRKEIVVDTVRLDGLTLSLARSSKGVTNWDDLIAASRAAKPEEKKEKPAAPQKAAPAAPPALRVRGLDIRRADIRWDDRASGARYAVQGLELKTGAIALGEPVDLKLGFNLESGQPPLRTRVDLKGRVNFNPERQTLDIPNLALTVGELALTASIQGTKMLDAPSVAGALEIAAFNPRALMEKFGAAYAAADKNALTRAALKTRFQASPNGAALKELAVSLDDSRLTGALAVRNFAGPAIQFDLALDKIDIDRYLPPPAPKETAKPAAPAAGAKPAEIPLASLRALTANGKLRIQSLKAFGLSATDALLQVDAAGGLIRLGPNQAKLYGGAYRGNSQLDARGNTAALNLDESLSGVQLAPLLKDAAQFEHVAGAAQVSAKLTAQGLDPARIKSSLNGTAQFAVKDGVAKGLDLKKMYGTIESAIQQKSAQNLKELPPKPGDETRFSQLNGSAVIRNGVVQNDDLKVQVPDLVSVSGKGAVNLPQESVDYTVVVGAYGVRVTGPFSDLKFRPEVKDLGKQVVEKKLEQKKEELKEDLKQKLKGKLKVF